MSERERIQVNEIDTRDEALRVLGIHYAREAYVVELEELVRALGGAALLVDDDDFSDLLGEAR